MRRGFALVVALWLLVTLAALAGEVATAARVRRRAAASAAEGTVALAAAEGGIEQARGRLDRLLRDEPTRASEAARAAVDPWHVAAEAAAGEGAIGVLRFRVTVREPAAQLDVNRASEAQLRALFAALRIDDARADRAVQGILDWRDGDGLRRARGAERDDYVRAGSALLPANGDFTTLATLREVLGVTDEIYARVVPELTVVGDGKIDVNSADRAVLLTLPGVTEPMADAIVRLRRQGRYIDDLYGFASQLPAGMGRAWIEATPQLYRLTTVSVDELLVTCDAGLPGSPVRVRVEALVVRDAGARVVWRRRR